MNIDKEGFVGVRQSTDNLRSYFFYLTYSNRAEVYSSIKSKENNFDFTNNLNTYYRYSNFRNNQGTKTEVNALELVLSASSEFNIGMSLSLGRKNWENKQKEFIVNLLEEKLGKTTGFLLFGHKLDSTGYRVHYHALISPYVDGEEVLGEKINYVKRYLDKEILIDIKKEYKAFLNKEYSSLDSISKRLIENKHNIDKKEATLSDFKNLNIKYFEEVELEQEELLEIESLKSSIKEGSLNSSDLISLLMLCKNDRELFNLLSKEYSVDSIYNFYKLFEKNTLVSFLFLDYLVKLLKDSLILEENFLLIISEMRKSLKGESKVVFEDKLSHYIGNVDLYKISFNALEQSFNKKRDNELKKNLDKILFAEKVDKLNIIEEKEVNEIEITKN